MEHAQQLDRLVTDLERRHPRFRRSTIERLVDRAADPYRDAPVQAFVPVLVGREAQAQLRYVEGLALAADPSDRHDLFLLARAGRTRPATRPLVRHPIQDPPERRPPA